MVAQWTRIYLIDIAPLRVNVSTIDSTYRPKVERWIIPRLGKHRLDRIAPEHLYTFYGSLSADGLAPNTIVQIHRILCRALTMAVRQERIARNPCTLIDAPKAEASEPEPLTAAEARALLVCAAWHRNGTRWSVALALGLRQNEALGPAAATSTSTSCHLRLLAAQGSAVPARLRRSAFLRRAAAPLPVPEARWRLDLYPGPRAAAPARSRSRPG